MALSLGVAIFQYQAKMEARARIAEVEAHTDSLLATIADRDTELDSVYVALDSVEARADSVIAVSKLREDQAYRRARHTADDLREALANDEELTAMLNSLTASYEATIDALRIQVVELERVRDEQGNLIDLQKVQLADYAEAVEGLQTQVEFWEGEANPAFWEGVWEDLPQIGAAIGVGLLFGILIAP
jgi:chromosome segregation ATPase